MNVSPVIPRLVLSATCWLFAALSAEADYRPALVGNGAQALVNLIDAQKLAAKGQTDALVMFQCYVSKTGVAFDGMTFRDTANSKTLSAAVRSALGHCRFVPALYNGKPIAVQFFGTAMLFMADGKPHLRIYAHQNLDDLKQQKDFVAPQLIVGTEDWTSAKAMVENDRKLLENGFAEVSIDVDAEGFVKGIKVQSEQPPGYKYGEATVKELTKAHFIPGYRNGKPVACNFAYTQLMRAVPRLLEKGLKGSLIPGD